MKYLPLFIKKSFVLFTITCFVCSLISTSVYSSPTRTESLYGEDLLLDQTSSGSEISYKVVEYRKATQPIPIEKSPKYRRNAQYLQHEMIRSLKELSKEKKSELENIPVGAIFFSYSYPDNLDIVIVSENKVEGEYKRKVSLAHQYLKENLRSAVVAMNIVNSKLKMPKKFSSSFDDSFSNMATKFTVAMELFSSTDQEREAISPKYSLKKVNPWIFITETFSVAVQIVIEVRVGNIIIIIRREEVKVYKITRKIWVSPVIPPRQTPIPNPMLNSTKGILDIMNVFTND